MLIRSQDKEILVNFNVSAGIEIAEGTTKNSCNIIYHWMQLFTRRIFHQRKSYESTGHDSGSLYGF